MSAQVPTTARGPRASFRLALALAIAAAALASALASAGGQSSQVSDSDLRRMMVESINEVRDLRDRLAALEVRVDELDATCARVRAETQAAPPTAGRSM